MDPTFLLTGLGVSLGLSLAAFLVALVAVSR